MNFRKAAIAIFVYVIIPGGTAFALYKSIVFIMRRIKHPVQDMQPSDRLTDKIKQFETSGKDRLDSYMDANGIDWDIGFGHNLSANGPLPGQPDITNTHITKQQQDQLLADDIKTAFSAVKKYIKVPVNQDQVDVLTDLAFIMGGGNFGNSSLVRKINGGASAAQVAGLIEQYNAAQGQTLPGLADRAKWHASAYSII